MSYKLNKKQIKTVCENAAQALLDYCTANNIHYVITGSSGGLDSAVTLGLAQVACKMAKKKNFRLTSVGLILPCNSKPEAEELGREAIEKFGAEEIFLDFSCLYSWLDRPVYLGSLKKQVMDILKKTGGMDDCFEHSEKIASGNIKARLRMMLGTYHVARLMKGIVLSTDNLSEYWMAFWTLHGDVGDFSMIQHLTKGLELYDVARYLGVPQGIIDAKPDDGLGISGGDEDQLGAAYPVLDKIMITLIQKGFDPDGSPEQLRRLPPVPGVEKETIMKIARRAIGGAYKRKGTVMLTRAQLGLPEIKNIKL